MESLRYRLSGPGRGETLHRERQTRARGFALGGRSATQKIPRLGHSAARRVCLPSTRMSNRAREHRPLSRGLSDGPQPYQGRPRAGPVPLCAVRARLRDASGRAEALSSARDACSGHRRRRLHRLEPRRRAARARRRGDCDRQPLTGKRENLAGAVAAGAQLHEVDVRDATARGRRCSRTFGPRSSSIWPPRSTSASRSTTRRPTRTINVLGTIAVLEAARAHGARRVVNTSTGGGLYGDADVLPTPEDHPIRPLAPYGQSKYAAEGYCELYTRLHGLSTVSLRYGNVYGPRQDVHGEAGVVAIFCGHWSRAGRRRSSATAARPATGSTSRDVVRANLLAADSELTGPINIGHGQETSRARPARRAATTSPPTGRRSPSRGSPPARPGEVRRSCLDVTRARRELGWEPDPRCATGCGGSWRDCEPVDPLASVGFRRGRDIGRHRRGRGRSLGPSGRSRRRPSLGFAGPLRPAGAPGGR